MLLPRRLLFQAGWSPDFATSVQPATASLRMRATSFPHYLNDCGLGCNRLQCGVWSTWHRLFATPASSRLPMLKVLLVLGLQLSAAEVSRANSSTTPTSRPLIIVLGMSMSGTESPNPDPDPQPLTLSLTRMPKSGTEP